MMTARTTPRSALAVVTVVMVLTVACGDRNGRPRAPGPSAPTASPTSPADGTEAPPPPGESRPSAGAPRGSLVIDSASANQLEQVPDEWIDRARDDLHVFYGRLSHGDQVHLGLDILAAADGDLSYDSSFLDLFYSSLDPRPDTPAWEPATRKALASGKHNVVMWAWSSWLGKPDKVDERFVADQYLAKLEQLERDFPGVRFVYCTGPAQTYRDPDGHMRARNQQIRDYAIAHGKVLFDVEDIELRDPSGELHADGTDACEWCATWCAEHDCAPAAPGGCCGDTCTKCSEWSHSHCFNCYRKGRAFWVLAARLAGWPGR